MARKRYSGPLFRYATQLGTKQTSAHSCSVLTGLPSTYQPLQRVPLPLLHLSHRLLERRRHIHPDGKLNYPEPLVLPLGAVAQDLLLV